MATLVTTRSSGSSYLNRVELQNGCLSLGHSNTFIPSTLAGVCTDQDTGAINEEVLRKNLNLAISAYINRVNGCPCGDTSIHLYRGADTSEHLQVRNQLLTFLKGSKAAKDTLRQEHPNQYIFLLLCCFRPDCAHPLCRKGQMGTLSTRYEGGPITHLPLPVPDPDRPWGNSSCATCDGFCAGTEKEELWIACDVCDQWYCSSCEGLRSPPVTDIYVYAKCRQ